MTHLFSARARSATVAWLAVLYLLISLQGSRGQEANGERSDDERATTAIADEGTAADESGARTVESPDAPADFDAKRPAILGMTVVEDESGRPKVVDVGAATPAWDAGVRKDDVILALHGVESKSFQEWVDGVKKVVADAVDGQTVPIKLLRDGEPLDLQVRLPVSQANRIPRRDDRRRAGPNQQQVAGVAQAPAAAAPGYSTGSPYPPGGAYPAGGGVGIGIGDDGGTVGAPVADDRVPMQAAAQLFAVNGAAGRGVAPGAALPTGQVGSAEFSDDAGGLRAVISLLGLPPGRYRVGIGEVAGGAFAAPQTGLNPIPDGGVITDGFQDGRPGVLDRRGRAVRQAPANNRRPTAPIPANREGALPPDARPGGTPTPVGTPRTAPTEAGGTPAGTGVQGAGGAGGTGGASAPPAGNNSQLPNASSNVLAQVAPGRDQTPTNPSPSGNAATGQLPPRAAPPTGPAGNRQPSPRSPRDGLRGAQDLDTTRAERTGSAIDAGAGTAGLFGLDLGFVNVGVGGGQAHQRLEGVRVASIVGQSVIVVSAGDTGAGGIGADPRLTGDAQRSLDRSRRDRLPNATNSGVVAAGVIRALPNGRPAAAAPRVGGAQPVVQPAQTDAEGNVQPPATPPRAPANRNVNQ